MKWLKIIIAGIAIWLLSLILPDLNRIMSSSITISLIIGLAIASSVCLFGRYLGQQFRQRKQNSNGHTTRPTPVFRAEGRHRNKRHAQPTLPMSKVYKHSIHSRPTRPLPSGMR